MSLGWKAVDAMLPESENARTWRDRLEPDDIPPGIETARDLAVGTDPVVPWSWRGYLAYGAITELSGHAKRAGKTTLALAAVAAIVEGREFLGQRTQPSPVVILTEQTGPSLREAIAATGLSERDDVFLWAWHASRGRPWSEIVADAVNFCATVDAGVLIVDTLPRFASMAGDAENDSGSALAALEPLQAAAAIFDLAILIVRHDRKSGGEVGESARGSSAFTAGVDIVLQLARQKEADARTRIRVLSALSRFSETPDELVIELGDDGYAVIGTDAGSMAYATARKLIVEIVADGEQRTRKDIQDALTGMGDATKPTMRDAALRSLVTAGEIQQSGKGVKGDPHLFQRVSPILSLSLNGSGESKDSVSPIPPLGEGETNEAWEFSAGPVSGGTAPHQSLPGGRSVPPRRSADSLTPNQSLSGNGPAGSRTLRTPLNLERSPVQSSAVERHRP